MDDALYEEYPLSFINGLESLQCEASTKLAFNLWQHKYFSCPPTEIDSVPSFLQGYFSCDNISQSVPSRIKEMINEKIEKIRYQLREWINFLRKAALFDQNFLDVLPQCFHTIVFNPNGSICFRRSALNMMKNIQFNNLEKYKIACTFCLENEVSQIWRLVSQDSLVTRNGSDQYDLVYYWNLRMNLEVDPVTVGERFQKSFDTRNWAALEYFFDMFTDDDLSHNMTIFYGRGRTTWSEDFEFMMHIFRKLNKDQARKIFQGRPSRLLNVLVTKDEYFSDVCKLWLVMKQYVFEDVHVFLNVLRNLWKTVFGLRDLNFTVRDRVNRFLIEIWTTAPDHIKSHFTEGSINFFFRNWPVSHHDFSYRYGHDMTFLLQLFSYKSYENRNQIWGIHWTGLIPISKPLYLEEFMKLSLPNEETIKKFKLDNFSVWKFNHHFSVLVELAVYSDFSDYLHFFSDDSKRIQDLSKEVFESNADKLLLYDDDKFHELDAFICSICSNVIQDVNTFKEQIILSNKSIRRLYRSFNEYCLEDFIQIVNKFVKSDQSLEKVKRELLNYCRDHAPCDNPFLFDRNKWVKLLEWCTANPQEISAFQLSFNVDEIFEKQITNYASIFPNYRGSPTSESRAYLSIFDEFALWYFGDEGTLKKFKMNKIVNHKNCSAIRKIFETKTDPVIIWLLKWFFDEDLRLMREFQQYSGVCKISKLEF